MYDEITYCIFNSVLSMHEYKYKCKSIEPRFKGPKVQWAIGPESPRDKNFFQENKYYTTLYHLGNF